MRLAAFRGLILPMIWAGLLALGTVPAFADGFTITLNFDERCNGVLNGFTGSVPMPCGMIPDPGPGGLTNVMFYNMLNPPGLVGGDVVILEPGSATAAVVSDLLRFDPNVQGGGVFVYSDIDEGATDLADIGFPGGYNTNLVTITEVGPEGSNGVSYTPTAGQPGFVGDASAPVEYDFISDVPEPTTGILLLAPLAALLLHRRKRTA
ncbi:MAG: PEP-CTERM sorting domain-containing protein [Bryobacteraceae bacterium]